MGIDRRDFLKVGVAAIGAMAEVGGGVAVAQEAAALLHACMEGASDFMEWYFDWPLQVPVPSDTSWGASMMDEDHIPGVKERAAVIRGELRTRYMDGYTPSFA